MTAASGFDYKRDGVMLNMLAVWWCCGAGDGEWAKQWNSSSIMCMRRTVGTGSYGAIVSGVPVRVRAD